MTNAVQRSPARSRGVQQLFLAGLLILLISPTLAMAEVIYEDTFEGLLSPNWVSDWGQWASQGYDGTNNPPTLGAANIPIPRPVDTAGKISTGVVGWTTLRGDPVNAQDPPGCDLALGECGPCDPATQECFERADGTVRMDDIDISNITTDHPFFPSGVHMGLVGRFENGIQRAISGNYITVGANEPAIFFDEFFSGTFSNRVSNFVLPGGALQSPIHMEMTIEGDDVTFKVGDPTNEYEISMVQGTYIHFTAQIPVNHTRPNPDSGRWGFFSHSTANKDTDWTLWDNFCFTDVGETCGVQAQPGDHDGDGDVDGNDFLWHQISDPSAINTDWGPNYGTGPLSGVAAVPEVSTIVFCCVAIVTGLGIPGRGRLRFI